VNGRESVVVVSVLMAVGFSVKLHVTLTTSPTLMKYAVPATAAVVLAPAVTVIA
jgi:hypothetical protein